MKNGNNSTTTRYVIGIVGMVIFGILLVIFLPGMLIFSLFGGGGFFVAPVIVFAALFVLSAILMNSGRKRKVLIGRLSRYMAELSTGREVMGIEEMSSVTGYSPTLIRNDMVMLKRWSLSFDLYTDKGATTLIKGEGAYGEYLETERRRLEHEREEAERQARLQNPATATLEMFRGEGASVLDRLRAANLVLPGEGISNSLSALERTMKRIFDHIENHPEKLPEMRRIMNYHLPTTMKLIDKYCQYDTMEFQPENVALAKVDIERALQAANEAFANFLEGLFQEDTLDVTTDAEVLTKMFEKDGMTGSKFDIK